LQLEFEDNNNEYKTKNEISPIMKQIIFSTNNGNGNSISKIIGNKSNRMFTYRNEDLSKGIDELNEVDEEEA
jgi:hypothetical protein